eukprot:1761566-Pyramimonas_sp.AAC.1
MRGDSRVHRREGGRDEAPSETSKGRRGQPEHHRGDARDPPGGVAAVSSARRLETGSGPLSTFVAVVVVVAAVVVVVVVVVV